MTTRRRKAQPLVSQSKARSDSKRFLWHFKDSPHKEFSHRHWWKDNPQAVSVEAAIWEILRRHPRAHEGLEQVTSGIRREGFPQLQAWVGFHCLLDWTELSESLKTDFIRRIQSLPPQHGWLPPPMTVLNDFRKWRALLERIKSRGDGPELKKCEATLRKFLVEAVENCHDRGQLMVAIDVGAPIPAITKAITSAVENFRGDQKPHDVGKNRIDDALAVVSEFEKKELSRDSRKTGRDDQLFARYRRIIQSWRWPDGNAAS